MKWINDNKIIICLVALNLLLIIKIFDLVGSSDEKEETTKPNVPPAQNFTLGMDFATFRNKYEHNLSRYEVSKLEINETINKKDEGKFFCYLGDTVGIIGDYDTATQMIYSITVSSEPKKSPNGNKAAIILQTLAFDSVISIFNPTLTDNARQQITKKLTQNLKHNSVTIDNVTYESRVYNEVIMFSVKPAKR